MDRPTEPRASSLVIEYGILPPRRRQPVLAFVCHLTAIFTGLVTLYCALQTVGGGYWLVVDYSRGSTDTQILPVVIIVLLVVGLVLGYATMHLWHAGEVYSLTRAPRSARGSAET